MGVAIGKALLTSYFCLLFLPPWAWAKVLVQQGRFLRGQQWQHDCDIQQLTAVEPTRRMRAEAGVVEIWEPSDRSSGVLGGEFKEWSCLDALRPFNRRHQRILKVRQGDVIGSPPGVIQYTYNYVDTPLVSVTLLDLSSSQNQLDLNFRSFYLAGNLQGQEGEVDAGGNVFHGFHNDLLEDIFQMDAEVIRRVKGENNDKGSIIRVDQGSLKLLIQNSEKMTTSSVDNGIEETFCSMSFIHNIDEPSYADVFNPLGGYTFTLNGHKLPLLQSVHLSAERVVLYKNATMTPHWNMNAHSLMYFKRGAGRIQVAGEKGRLVFHGRVQEGQMLVVPQNFVVVNKAEKEGLEWVAFKTNDNAMISPLAGRISAIQGMPEEVLMNCYGLSREEVRRLKYGRQELSVFSPTHM